MSWVLLLIIFAAGTVMIALLVLAWFVRMLLRDAETLDEMHLDSQVKRRSFHHFINPLSWWRREKTIRLFYQRDARGRFRKIRRH